MDSGFQKMHGFLGLAFRYSPARFESACNRALFYGQTSILDIMNIFERKLDQLSLNPDSDIEGQILLKFQDG